MLESHRKAIGTAGTRPERSPLVKLVLEGIAQAFRLAIEADEAYGRGDVSAGPLQTAAENAHHDLLGDICELSEEQADAVEPAFTELETRLSRLPSGSPRSFPR
jgi:hypothetical protein